MARNALQVSRSADIISKTSAYGKRMRTMSAKMALTTLRKYLPEDILQLENGDPSEGDWTDYRLEHDPRFLARISKARESIFHSWS